MCISTSWRVDRWAGHPGNYPTFGEVLGCALFVRCGIGYTVLQWFTGWRRQFFSAVREGVSPVCAA